MNAAELAKRLAEKHGKTDGKPAKSNAHATQTRPDHLPYPERAKTPQNPQNPARDWWHVYPERGADGRDVFFHPPQTFENVRKIFYPHAFSVIAMDQK